MSTLNDKFTIANSRLNNEIRFIKQAFINFYGEKHRDYIINILDNLNVIWHDDSQKKEDKDIKNLIISSLPEDRIDEYLKKHDRECFLQSAYIDEIDVLVLPLSYNMTQIIHELNHKISSHILSLEPLEMISGLCISREKNGGVVGQNIDLNEVINQKMTLEILDELRKLGIEVHYTPAWQENMFPLINLFYDIFKENLKDIYITGDLMSFIKIIGVENYDEFSRLMFMKCFKLRRMLIKGQNPLITEDDIKKVENIVVSMQRFSNEQNISENRRKI